MIDAQTLFLGAMEFQDDNQTAADDATPSCVIHSSICFINQLAPPLIRNAVPEETREPLKTAFANFSRNNELAGSSRGGNADA